MRTKILLTTLTLGAIACDDPGTDVAPIEAEAEPGDAPSTPSAFWSPESTTEPTTDPESIELNERDDTLTLTARDVSGAEIGAMVLEKVGAEPGTSAVEPTWFPIYASGYFDVTGLDESEVDDRVLVIVDEIGGHPVEAIVGCALRIAAAAVLCMDGPALVVSCPVGLHSVMCGCGPEVGIPKRDLAKFCDWD